MNSLFKVSQEIEESREWAKRVATNIQQQRKEIYYKDIGNGDIATIQHWIDSSDEDGWDLNDGIARGYLVQVFEVNGKWEEL